MILDYRQLQHDAEREAMLTTDRATRAILLDMAQEYRDQADAQDRKRRSM